MKRLLILAMAMATAGCEVGRPAHWASELSTGRLLECDMTIKNVESLAKKTVQRLAPAQTWRTHFISVGETVVWLGFVEGRLRYHQISWPVQGRMAQTRGYNACSNLEFDELPEVR